MIHGPGLLNPKACVNIPVSGVDCNVIKGVIDYHVFNMHILSLENPLKYGQNCGIIWMDSLSDLPFYFVS